MPTSLLLPEVSLAIEPKWMVMLVDADEVLDSSTLAEQAVETARRRMPKVTGASAQRLAPVSGADYFGIYFPDRHTWFLEQGTRPFTMNKLHGAIPIWVDDPMGRERKANPKAKIRITKDGRTQVLIFRYASPKGARKTVIRRGRNGLAQPVTVPASYPGAPGRIARRQANRPLTAAGKIPGQIAAGNSGVRWRNPGITARQFLNSAIAETALDNGLELASLYLCDDATFFALVGA